MSSSSLDIVHRRRNALNGDWVLVSPHRTQRPWQGQQEKTQDSRPSYDPTCYLCPGNTRANGEVNPDYKQTYVFDNDFAALLPTGVQETRGAGSLFESQTVAGTCRVICFAPRHDLTFAQMELSDIEAVLSTWIQETQVLSEKYTWVQVFENKGSVMGCSNPHPHGQIWASSFIPLEPSKEEREQKAYLQKTGNKLLLDYLAQELKSKDRLVVENEDWAVVVPYWAVWPFETLLLPKFSIARLTELKEKQKKSLAAAMKSLLQAYDALFETSFPYSMGWHGAPFMEGNWDHWQLHAHFYPPLLRSATVKKFMVGYEMLGEPQRDLTPESAAERLRVLVK
ncbi:MAG: UDP-glucose--hexose-1-phosphate uridylyltransferase [Verrucomicrobiota bacterium]